MSIQNVSVVGMGTMGSQIGIVCALGGFQTYLHDVTRENVDKGRRNIEGFLAQRVKKGKAIQEKVNEALGRLRMGADLGEAVAEADLIIEAVYEDIQIKKQIFKGPGRSKPQGSHPGQQHIHLVDHGNRLCHLTPRPMHRHPLFDPCRPHPAG